MAEPATIVSPQITDSVTQANTKVLGDVPAFAASNLMQAASQVTALSMQNAVSAQQQANMVHQASTTEGINILYSSATSVAGQSVGVANRSADYSKMIEALTMVGLVKKPVAGA